MRHEKISVDDRRHSGALADLYLNAEPFRSAASTPDIPASIGMMIITSYVMLLGSFAVTMIGSPGTALALAICFFFLGMYLLVPATFLKVEPQNRRRPSLSEFMETGIQTFTGHMKGKDALAQILMVPLLLTGAAIVMGIIAMTLV
jgi:putative Ca2+/H+ antiporter (TMEM165/GDT1 family)